jgi:hypothetical protein
MPRRLAPLVFQIIVLCCAVAIVAPAAQHPNLLLNRNEIEQVKAKVAQYPLGRGRAGEGSRVPSDE